MTEVHNKYCIYRDMIYILGGVCVLFSNVLCSYICMYVPDEGLVEAETCWD